MSGLCALISRLSPLTLATPADPHAPGPSALADQERTRGILAGVGYHHISIEKFNGVVRLSTSAEQAAIQLSSFVGPASRALKNVDDETRARPREAIAHEMRAFQGDARHRLLAGKREGLTLVVVLSVTHRRA
jgi:hypothetical protein